MNNFWKTAALISMGIIVGSLGKDLLGREAHAEGAAPAVKYKVVGASMTEDGYSEDLNKFTSQGWRYVGPVAVGDRGSLLIFAKP